MQFKVKNFNENNSNKYMTNYYKLVLIVMYIFGFNFKAFKLFNRFNVLSVIYSLCLIIFTSLATIYSNENFNFLHIWSLFEYISCVLILVIYNSKLNEFSAKLSNIDTHLKVNYKYYFRSKVKLYLIILIVWVTRICFMTIHCMGINCFTIFSLFLTSLFALFALDMNRVWRFFLLDIVRYRLSLLRKRLEKTSGVIYYLYTTNNETLRKNKIKFFTKMYRDIADIADLISPEVHASVSIEFYMYVSFSTPVSDSLSTKR